MDEFHGERPSPLFLVRVENNVLLDQREARLCPFRFDLLSWNSTGRTGSYAVMGARRPRNPDCICQSAAFAEQGFVAHNFVGHLLLQSLVQSTRHHALNSAAGYEHQQTALPAR